MEFDSSNKSTAVKYLISNWVKRCFIWFVLTSNSAICSKDSARKDISSSGRHAFFHSSSKIVTELPLSNAVAYFFSLSHFICLAFYLTKWIVWQVNSVKEQEHDSNFFRLFQHSHFFNTAIGFYFFNIPTCIKTSKNAKLNRFK